ncbi:RNA 2'-phosphotransferase [Planctomycetes bacterium K23_9]|uniref:RNA 2'-phosphotransferase n=1 Tax=Stieleria marina TaxID=1930275 RepID=A0A517NWE0_9BACT|nr:RNA 2'-phosphotransferase [Planctomycetes bacterium K23_9]
MNKRLTKISKYLSFVLSHHPEAVGLTLDSEGWIDVEELVVAAVESGKTMTVQNVMDVIAQSERKRFELSDDGKRIRALQEAS